MSRNAARLIIFVTAIVARGQEPSEPSQTSVEITGTVVNSVTGQPIAGASVVLSTSFQMRQTSVDPAAANQSQPRLRQTRSPADEHQAVTDEGGKFSFQAVLKMGWSLAVSHRGYRAPGVGGDIVHVQGTGMGQTKPDAFTVKLDPLGVIEGKLANEDGEPLPGISVELWKIDIPDGRRTLRRTSSKTSDDLGAYRLWDISPGSYYVKVAGRRGAALAAAGTPQPSQFMEAYGPMYFPSSPDLEGAKVIRLAPGETLHADFEVPAHQAYRVHGSFVNPISSRRVVMRLLRGDDEVGNRSGVNESAGTFDVFDVTPGAYTLQAYSSDAGMTLFGETQFSIGNGDLNGLAVSLSPAVSLDGKLDQAGRARMVQISASYSLQRRLPPGLGGFSHGAVDEEGRFRLENLWPGHYDVSIRTFEKKFVRSASSGSTDVLSDGLTIGSSGAPEPMKIQLEDGAGTISAQCEDGEPDAASIVVAVAPKSGTPGSLIISPMALTQTQDPGTNTVGLKNVAYFAGLAPGDYSVYAWRSTQQVEYRNPTVLAAMSTSAVSVSVGNGESKEVTVKLIPKGDN